MDYSNFISNFAELCTIAAFFIALIVWITWRNPQNYSFKRDKIFEAEFAVSKMYSALEFYYEKYKVTKAEYICNNSRPLDPRYLHQGLLELEAEFQKCINGYIEALYCLSILEVSQPKEFFFSKKEIQEEKDRFLIELNAIWNVNELYDLIDNKILLKLNKNKVNALGYLKKVRESI